MSLADQTQPTRVPGNWRESIWPSFQADVLAYVDRGCELLQVDPGRRLEWRERDFTWALIRHLERIREDRWEYLVPRYDSTHLSDEDFAQGASPHGAPIIDLVVRWHYREPLPHFAIEAKVLVSRLVGNYAPGRTVGDYVSKGMNRFVDEEYGMGLPAGAMIGYILSGTPAELAASINKQIMELPLRCTAPLTVRAAESSNRPRYESEHPRSSATIILIHHLFIKF
jgi:hypothetical protein